MPLFKTARVSLLGAALCALAVMVSAEELHSPYNGKPLPAIASPALRFFVFGHLYGDPRSNTVFPAGSFQSAIERINEAEPDLIVMTGDAIRFPEEPYLGNTRTVLERVDAPIFNAPGNHDLIHRGGPFKRLFGPVYRELRLGQSLFLLLNTEIERGQLGEEQRQWFFDHLSEAIEDDDIRHLFIFSHRLVWAAWRPEMDAVFANVNNPIGLDYTEFAREIEPRLLEVAAVKPTYWFGGDIGTIDSFSLFYHRHSDAPLYYLAAGLGDTSRDAIIRVDVGADGDVSLAAMPLAGQTLEPLETYDLDFWRARFPGSSEVVESLVKTEWTPWRRLIALFGKPAFYAGTGAGLGLAVLLFALARWRRPRTPS